MWNKAAENQTHLMNFDIFLQQYVLCKQDMLKILLKLISIHYYNIQNLAPTM